MLCDHDIVVDDDVEHISTLFSFVKVKVEQ